jgi:uncharacterized protein
MRKIPVEISHVSYYPETKGYTVLLKDIGDNERYIPIVVGNHEAQTIAMALEGVELPRPFTHDLMMDIIDELDTEVQEILISAIDGETYYAELKLINPTRGIVVLDARPSDAITIALKSDIQIMVNENIFDNVQTKVENMIKPFTETRNDDNIVSIVDTAKNLKNALNRAINDENYEVAAKLRDSLGKITKQD